MTEPTNLPHTVKRLDGAVDFPRRSCVDQWTPPERAIAEAVDAVERAGASVHLTDAVILLGKAQNAVADHVEGLPVRPQERGDVPARRAVVDAISAYMHPKGKEMIEALADRIFAIFDVPPSALDGQRREGK
jgi:hypothetical protein